MPVCIHSFLTCCFAEEFNSLWVCTVLPVRIRMRRKAVKALVMHTKDSIRHLKDDDDEMLRGQI